MIYVNKRLFLIIIVTNNLLLYNLIYKLNKKKLFKQDLLPDNNNMGLFNILTKPFKEKNEEFIVPSIDDKLIEIAEKHDITSLEQLTKFNENYKLSKENYSNFIKKTVNQIYGKIFEKITGDEGELIVDDTKKETFYKNMRTLLEEIQTVMTLSNFEPNEKLVDEFTETLFYSIRETPKRFNSLTKLLPDSRCNLKIDANLICKHLEEYLKEEPQNSQTLPKIVGFFDALSEKFDKNHLNYVVENLFESGLKEYTELILKKDEKAETFFENLSEIINNFEKNYAEFSKNPETENINAKEIFKRLDSQKNEEGRLIQNLHENLLEQGYQTASEKITNLSGIAPEKTALEKFNKYISEKGIENIK